ncbi:MAG: GDP-mannose 4,6-dehydratase, partial [Tenuifilaceae bacterium]
MIFVTGGTGLVGSHLLFELAQSGKKVKALKRKTSDTRLVERLFKYYANGNPGLFEQIEWVDGDLEDFHEVSNLLQGVN